MSGRQLDTSGEMQVGYVHRKAHESEGRPDGGQGRQSKEAIRKVACRVARAGGMRPGKRILGKMGLQHGQAPRCRGLGGVSGRLAPPNCPLPPLVSVLPIPLVPACGGRRTLGKEGQSRLDAEGRLYHPEPAFQCVRCHESGSPWGAPRGPSAPPALDSPSLSAQTGHRAPVPTSCWWANPTSLCLGFLTCTRGYINLASGCWEHHLT